MNNEDKKQVLMLTLMPLDNDNRILKEIRTISKMGIQVSIVSVNSNKKFEFNSLSVMTTSKKLFGIPGLNKLVMMFKYFKSIPKKKKFDVIHCHDLDAFVLGCLYKIMYCSKCKMVYDAHEYETERNGMTLIGKAVSKFFEKSFIHYANKVICVSPSIANDYARIYNIEKPDIILNTPLSYHFEKKDTFREVFKIDKDKTIFLYQGGLASGRGIEILLKAFKDIDNKNAVIIFMGYGKLQNMIQEAANEYNNIYFHEAVVPEVLLKYTSSADFGFSTIEDICLSYRYSLPNKMFEYLMAEVPLIVSNLPDMQQVVRDNQIGIVIDSNTIKGIHDAISNALALNKNKLKANILNAKTQYSWENQEIVLENIYTTLLRECNE